MSEYERKYTKHESPQAYWEAVHQQGYSDWVWSITEDKKVQQKIIEELGKLPNRKKILLPGCGSKEIIENLIAKEYPDVDAIKGTDYPEVIAHLGAISERITYEERDSTELGYHEEWDTVLIINSIVSETDEENSAIIKSCSKALSPRGVFMGFFPTVFATMDIAYTEGNEERLRCVNPWQNVFHEPRQGVSQKFYTPLRLRNLIKNAGLGPQSMEIFFCDGIHAMQQTEKHYGITNPDTPLYEIFIKAKKDSYT